MSAGELRKGYVGPLEFQIKDQNDAPVDLTGITSMDVKIELSNNALQTRSASFVNSGTDGLIEIVTQASDLSVVGKVRFQAVVVLGGITYPSDIIEDYIYENLL